MKLIVAEPSLKKTQNAQECCSANRSTRLAARLRSVEAAQLPTTPLGILVRRLDFALSEFLRLVLL